MANKMLIDAAQKADAAQMEVNKVEAGSSSMFIAGWRPFVGWVCAAGCAWNWIGLPVGMFVVALAGRSLDLRPADLSEMLPLLLGLLPPPQAVITVVTANAKTDGCKGDECD